MPFLFGIFGSAAPHVNQIFESDSESDSRSDSGVMQELSKLDTTSVMIDPSIECSINSNLFILKEQINQMSIELELLKTCNQKLMKEYVLKKQVKYIANLSNDKLMLMTSFDFAEIFSKCHSWEILFSLKYETMCHMLSHGTNLNTLDRSNRFFLYYLVTNEDVIEENPEFLEFIDGKFDLENKGGNQKTVIEYACSYNNIPMIKFLLSKGVSCSESFVVDYLKKNSYKFLKE